MIESRRASWVARFVLFLLGSLGVAWLVSQIGVTALWRVVRRGGAWFGVVVALEGVRVALDAYCTHLLFVIGSPAPRAPARELFRAQLIAYPTVLLLPAGRAAGEALKASLLGRQVGFARACAAAVANQALPLLGGFAISLPAAWMAAGRWGWGHGFTLAILVQALTAVGLAALIVVAARARTTSMVVTRLSARFGLTVERIREEFCTLSWTRPLLVAVANRVVLAIEILLLTAVLGDRAWRDGLLLVGAHLVGAAAGDVIPAQVGATDAALAFAASSLAIPLDVAVGIALLFHASQLVWASMGAVTALVNRQLSHSSSQRSPEQPSRSKISPPGSPH